MSVKKEPSGRRSVFVEVEVPGTPEEVWKAIATGPGISSWFVPTKLEEKAGGELALDFGGGMVSTAKITEWKPPFKFVAEDRTWLQGGPPVATEWTVESKGGGKCVVRVVHSLFASTDDWDGQLEGTETGWPGYFRVLRHYLTRHAGETSASFTLMTPSTESARETFGVLARALGALEPRVGGRVGVDLGEGATMAGTIEALDDVPQGLGAMVVLDAPAPGVMLASGMECMGMKMATFQAFFYGRGAAAAAKSEERFKAWLLDLFPPAPETPPAS
jgi:uncharacterized protein YndB with AHSA1/START domain